MQYAQLINGVLRYAPKKVSIGDKLIYNPTGETLEALGYYPLSYTDMPDDAPQGYHYESGWQQGEASIIQIWTLAEDDDEITDDEALLIILGEET